MHCISYFQKRLQIQLYLSTYKYRIIGSVFIVKYCVKISYFMFIYQCHFILIHNY